MVYLDKKEIADFQALVVNLVTLLTVLLENLVFLDLKVNPAVKACLENMVHQVLTEKKVKEEFALCAALASKVRKETEALMVSTDLLDSVGHLVKGVTLGNLEMTDLWGHLVYQV